MDGLLYFVKRYSMKKVELLSPAGGYETMVGAFNAGADAVYLGGSKFGARAYADNFDTAQVLDAISYAHFHDKKIYMTVNTLIKEREYRELYDFMLPFAERKLDGVIVQDLGVARLIRNEFPDIELHASTQMTVTGIYGARLLKRHGFSRVVPARELSLSEMKAIREKADIEVEAFIHGAMCYCYSGACLFSSVVGGRSGNRGRCAQPCRLPYRIGRGKGQEQYLLSLKDMSTISILPELISAGIDSFKIEGRMKKPEYSAGVTALYRKYIDRYYDNPKEKYTVSKQDMDILKGLYQRTDISEGYYHRHNDRSMVTISSPAYNATSEETLDRVREKYLSSKLKLFCDFYCELVTGNRARLSMSVQKGDEYLYAEEYGSVVQPASKRPMDEENIKKQLKKLGDTSYEIGSIEIKIDDGNSGRGIFIAVSELNDLRRRLVSKMDALVLAGDKEGTDKRSHTGNLKDKEKVPVFEDYDYYESDNTCNIYGEKCIHVLVSTKDQLDAVLERADDNIRRIYIDCSIIPDLDTLSGGAEKGTFGMEFFAVLPYITRQEKWDGAREVINIARKAKEMGFAGLLIRSLEQLEILKEERCSLKLVLDYGVYCWNKEAALELLDNNSLDENFVIEGLSLPYELSFREAKEMSQALKGKCQIPLSYNIYGYLPMMISAGCVKKTAGQCSQKMNSFNREDTLIIDRMNNILHVSCICRSCYNVIWNAHPTSLHGQIDKVLLENRNNTFDALRIDFTVEGKNRCREVLNYFTNRISGLETEDIFTEEKFTTGYFKRGVE